MGGASGAGWNNNASIRRRMRRCRARFGSSRLRTVMVLVRLQTSEIRRVRSFSGDCQVDAGGLQVYWLGDVNAAQSVEFLKTMVTGPN